MNPDKKKTIRGHKIEQFYWTGRNVVYIDNHLTIWRFDEITKDNVEIVYKEAKAR